MAKTLDDAIEAVLYLVSQLDGLRKVASPQERYTVDPFATAFPGAGEWQKASSGMVKGLHSIVLLVLKVRAGDLPRELAVIIPYGELVQEKLLSDDNIVLPDSAGSATVDTITGLDWEFGPVDWGQTPYIGWAFEIGVKIW